MAAAWRMTVVRSGFVGRVVGQMLFVRPTCPSDVGGNDPHAYMA